MIEIEDKKYLVNWLKELDEADKLSLPHIPYNANEIVRELARRYNIEDMN